MKAMWMIGLTASVIASTEIEVLPMKPSHYNERAIIHRMYTEKGTLGGSGNPLVIQTIDFPLGISLPNKPDWFRGNAFRESGLGSTILVWLFGPSGFQKRITVVKQDSAGFIEERQYFKDRIRKYVGPTDLHPSGNHVAIAMMVNSFGESLKMRNAQKTLTLGDDPKLFEGLNKPFIVYNEPHGNFKKEHTSILLDFYVYNADIGSDAYKVQLYIDGKPEGMGPNNDPLTSWSPYKIRGLTPGKKHTVQIKLIGPDNKFVDEPFGEQKDVIFIGS